MIDASPGVLFVVEWYIDSFRKNPEDSVGSVVVLFGLSHWGLVTGYFVLDGPVRMDFRTGYLNILHYLVVIDFGDSKPYQTIYCYLLTSSTPSYSLVKTPFLSLLTTLLG